ncbi:RNase adapter RapZ [Vallitalea okinawensis]|uniref:RNase adapter RapZ n=1 Tax=Vallitalea okinawensis TaxID=2078660 RepID=UPI000CFC1310|nr:RNase adapter RapZ [Vallitalea okinawensis]
MTFLIVTGMSGAGKSTVIKILEDLGFFCVDNMPPELIPKFAEICFNSTSEFNKVALGVDIRGGKEQFNQLFELLESIKEHEYDYKVLFLDASDETLVKRFKETRRKHPLSKGEPILETITSERNYLSEAKKRANFIIDTSKILPRQLKEEIGAIFLEGKQFESLMVSITSFGFKYGIPSDSDLVFDVRFIPNPFYLPELKEQTGNNPAVREYVMQWDESKEFLQKLDDMVDFLIPFYIKEGKNQLVISIGCTGGKHRSVTLANALYERLKDSDYRVFLSHRDIENDSRRK